MKGGSVSVVCKGYITKVVWRAILALSGAWGPRELVILDTRGVVGEKVGLVKNWSFGENGVFWQGWTLGENGGFC